MLKDNVFYGVGLNMPIEILGKINNTLQRDNKNEESQTEVKKQMNRK